MFGRAYVSIDYTCRVLSIQKANEVAQHADRESRGLALRRSDWIRGARERSWQMESEWITVHFYDKDEERQVTKQSVIPSLSLALIESTLQAQNIPFDLYGRIKKFSLVSEPAAARERAEKIQTTAQ